MRVHIYSKGLVAPVGSLQHAPSRDMPFLTEVVCCLASGTPAETGSPFGGSGPGCG